MIRQSPLAVAALIEIAEYISARNSAAAVRFLDAFEATLIRLHEMPRMGHRFESARPALGEVRIWSVKGFSNCLVFYRRVKRDIEIIHVRHGARDIDAVITKAIESGDL